MELTENFERGMSNLGETLRELRIAQDLGLRETAGKVGISPAYLSRIERGKEPPKPEIIKSLAKILAADPDVLFRLPSSTDPKIVDFLHEQQEVMKLIRFIKENNFSNDEIGKLQKTAEEITGSRN